MSDVAQIKLEKVNKHYGAYHALRDVELTILKGQFVALVGPSGCGKSTLLRSLAGLESISSGNLWIDGELMNNTPPRQRDLAMVFQSYALYTHMTVEKNLTYSLRLKRLPKHEIQKAALEVAETIGLQDLLERYPRELSGGQRQRVAMGRAIIRNPKAFLFDEPLSNLDASLRVQMRKEIRSLHNRLNATSVYVTHDQIEAMTMADHVVVMREGVIEQQGCPLDLYDKPANRFVAGFIGSPAMNFLPGTVTESSNQVRLDLGSEQVLNLSDAIEPGRRIVVGIRPEHLKVGTSAEPGLKTEILFVEHTGASSMITAKGAPELIIIQEGRSNAAVGDDISLVVSPTKMSVFDEQTDIRISAQS